MAERYVVLFGLRARVGSKLWKTLKGIQLIIKNLPAPSRSRVELPTLLWHTSPNFSERAAKIDLVVLHDTEGPYSSAINWLSNPKAQASAHVVLREDGKEATQLVPYSKKAWSCVDFNSRSLNLEMAGKKSVGYGAAELDAAARIVAYWCALYAIPVRHAVGGSGSGITFHQELGVAGGNHSDPGFNKAQKAAFISTVKSYSGRGFIPGRWGHA
jgi:N-acetyl-anhydromuramyl-L-alanine amidase AmpD